MTDIDILLIQPSTLFSETSINPIVSEYFSTLSGIGGLAGDSPLEPNYGLLSIATILSQRGLRVKIIDFNKIDFDLRNNNKQLDENKIYQVLSGYNPSIIGISYMTTNYAIWEKRLRRTIRTIPNMNDVPLVYGGIHPSIIKKFQSIPDDDNLFFNVGEGEGLFLDLCLQYVNRLKTPFYKSRFLEQELLPSFVLNNLLLPDYTKWPTDEAERRYYTARGCSGVCAFCSARKLVNTTIGKNYYRPIYTESSCRFDFLTDQIYNDKKNGKKILIGDLTFFTDTVYSKQFCQKLIQRRESSGTTLNFWCQTRADCINNNTVALLKNAGASQVAIGGETTRTNSLKRLQKGITFNDTLRALETLKQHDLQTQLYMIIGAGGESRKDVEKNIFTICELVNNGLVDLVHLSVIAPFVGTGLFSNPLKYGIKIVDYDFGNYWMNCDMYGYGLPVYETIDLNGNTLLSQKDIFDLWLQALKNISHHYKSHNSYYKYPELSGIEANEKFNCSSLMMNL